MPDSSSRSRRSARRRRASSSGEHSLATSTSSPALPRQLEGDGPFDASQRVSDSVDVLTTDVTVRQSVAQRRHLLDCLLARHVALGLPTRRPARPGDVPLGHGRLRRDQPGDLHVGGFAPGSHLRHARRRRRSPRSAGTERRARARRANAATSSSGPTAHLPTHAHRYQHQEEVDRTLVRHLARLQPPTENSSEPWVEGPDRATCGGAPRGLACGDLRSRRRLDRAPCRQPWRSRCDRQAHDPVRGASDASFGGRSRPLRRPREMHECTQKLIATVTEACDLSRVSAVELTTGTNQPGLSFQATSTYPCSLDLEALTQRIAAS